MTDKKNIEDVTNSPDDWDDFWFNEDLGLSYSVDEETMRELMKLLKASGKQMMRRI